MKSVINRIVAGLVLVAVTGVVAFAKEKHSITLPTDIKVNGTEVKHGDYDLVFDEHGGFYFTDYGHWRGRQHL